jgi:sugar lactone lactonase YvrE
MTRRLVPFLAALLSLTLLLIPVICVQGAGSIGDDQADAVWGQTLSLLGVQTASFTSRTCSQPPSAYSLCSPEDVAIDASNNLWVADYGNNRVLMYAPGSIMANKVLGQTGFSGNTCNQGGNTPTAGTLCSPDGIAVDANGTLFVADEANNRVLVYFGAAGKSNGAPADLVLGQSTFSGGAINGNAGGAGSCPATIPPAPSQCTLSEPAGLSVTPNGDLLVADYGNNRVLLWPASLFNPSNRTTCGSSCYLAAIRSWGQYGSFSTRGVDQAPPAGYSAWPCPAPSPASACTLNTPTAAVADAHGNLFVADFGNLRVLEYDGALGTDSLLTSSRQAATLVYGSCGSFTSGACSGVSAYSLSGPTELALDPAGNLWVPDNFANRITEYNSPATTSEDTSTLTRAVAVLGQRHSYSSTDANNGGVSAGSLAQPSGVAFDQSGNLYVADYLNNRVLEFYQPYPISARIGLAQGWNLVALPSQTSLPYSASMVVSQVNQEGGKATMVAIYQNGSYQVYVPGYSADFPLAPKQGFWVLTGSVSVWALT